MVMNVACQNQKLKVAVIIGALTKSFLGSMFSSFSCSLDFMYTGGYTVQILRHLGCSFIAEPSQFSARGLFGLIMTSGARNMSTGPRPASPLIPPICFRISFMSANLVQVPLTAWPGASDQEA